MDASGWWWILTGALVIAELMTGTVYLLAIALGFAAGALAAHAGMSLPLQIIGAAAIGAITIGLWQLKRAKLNPSAVATRNPDMHLDIGATVWIDAWANDSTAQAQYRGAQWSVVAAHAGTQSAGRHRVVEVVGNRLVVESV